MTADGRPPSRRVRLPHPLPPPRPREAARLHIRLFGPLVATWDDAPLRRPSRMDTERLWLHLLLGAGAPTPRATIAADLWPDLESGPARTNLRFHLHHLHAALPPPDPSAPWIIAVDDALHWNADAPAWVDLFAWADALARAETADGVPFAQDAGRADAAEPTLPAAAVEALTLALDLQTTDLLPDHDGPWLAAWRDAAAAAMPRSVDRLVAHHAAGGAMDAAVAVATRAVDLDPLDEAAHHRLIAALAGAGHRTAALQAYARAVDILRAELDVEPSDDLVALAEALQRDVAEASDVSAGPAGAGGAADAALQAGAGLQTSVDRRDAAARVVGRAADVVRISALLHAHRLVTIVGPAGVGKSAVAAAVAAALEGGGASVAWLDVAAFEPPEACLRVLDQAIDAIASHRSVTASDAPPADDVAAPPAVECVLVLDNADRVLEPLGAHMPDRIARAPSVRLLVTSRRPLGLIGEARWSLRPFDGPGDAGAAGPGDDAARAIFTAAWWGGMSSSATSPPPPTTPAQRAAIERIAGAVGGLPLGLVIAGHAARTLGLETVAARMADAPLAVVDPTAADDRHRSLATALDWTLALLDPGDLGWLERLSRLDVPLTASTVEAVAEADGGDALAALDALGRLIDAGWLVPDGGADGTDGASGHRPLAVVRRYWTANPTT